MIPGEVIAAAGEIELNSGRETATLSVANTGDRPIQVGSHYHFFETNEALEIRARQARGHPPEHRRRHRGALEPGQTPRSALVANRGDRQCTVSARP